MMTYLKKPHTSGVVQGVEHASDIERLEAAGWEQCPKPIEAKKGPAKPQGGSTPSSVIVPPAQSGAGGDL